jgi:acyl carrier protein
MYYTIPNEFEIDKSSIEADASVIKTLNLDNQSFAKLVNLIKNYFCIEINNDEASSYLTDTFNDIYWFIAEKIEQKRRQYPSVAALVRDIAVWKLGVEEEEVVSQAHWIDDLGCDSLDAVELTMCFEAMFNIQIPDEVAEHLETVGDVVNYIEQNAI